MDVNENQQNGLVFEDRNGVELPMMDGDGPDAGTGAAGVYIGSISNHPYLGGKLYQEISNDDDDDNDDGNGVNEDIELVLDPVAITKKIIDIDE